ncbi:MAG TPA: tRNA pseudouridine(55) synthase TruB [Candidatus Limnocylindrales bacterium]
MTTTVDGILVLAKPAGPTSHDMVALVRRLSGIRRVGHGGTLDPFATGVLPIFLGRATRLVEYHLGAGKEYRATVCFGASSTTDDLEGELTPSDDPAPDRERVIDALAVFRGEIVQVPPAHSAVRIAGRRAYALARAGKVPELTARRVTIDRLELVEWDATEPERPIGVLDVSCSAGTYIRALARDLGVAVGNAAHLCALTRTASGPFTIARAHPLDEVRAAAAEGRLESLLLPVDAGLDGLPTVVVTPDLVPAIARGQFVRVEGERAEKGAGPVRVVEPDGRLVAIASWRDRRLAPDKVLVDAPGRADLPAGPEGRDAADVAVEAGAGMHLSDDDAVVDAAAAADRDPEQGVDPDPASIDDG